MAIDYLPELIDRIVKQCEEATPGAHKVLDYLLGDYAYYPHWRVGEIDYDMSTNVADFTLIQHTVVAELYGGKIAEGYDGDVERDLRPLVANAAQFFADNLRLQSTAYALPMRYLSKLNGRGVDLGRPIKTVRETDDGSVMVVRFPWTVTVQLPRKVS